MEVIPEHHSGVKWTLLHPSLTNKELDDSSSSGESFQSWMVAPPGWARGETFKEPFQQLLLYWSKMRVKFGGCVRWSSKVTLICETEGLLPKLWNRVYSTLHLQAYCVALSAPVVPFPCNKIILVCAQSQSAHKKFCFVLAPGKGIFGIPRFWDTSQFNYLKIRTLCPPFFFFSFCCC